MSDQKLIAANWKCPNCEADFPMDGFVLPHTIECKNCSKRWEVIHINPNNLKVRETK